LCLEKVNYKKGFHLNILIEKEVKMKTMQGFSLGAGIGICLISAYLMIKGYVNWGIVTLIIGVVTITVSSKKIRK